MATYNKYYKQKNYFGNPYAELMDFFQSYPARGNLADLGAGQGRDSIALQNMGYSVTSVDISDVGLDQIKQANENITTIQADVYAFDIKEYDFILLDSMLHFYKNDLEKETQWLESLLNDMKKGALLVNCLLKSAKAEKTLFKILNSFDGQFEILANKYIDYPEANCKYHMLSVLKKMN